MRIQHKPGDSMEVDWAGATIDIYDDVKTDGVSWIHIISPYSKASGWFDMANLENYVKDYQDTGLDETEDYGIILA